MDNNFMDNNNEIKEIDFSVESAFNITRLSSLCCWLEDYNLLFNNEKEKEKDILLKFLKNNIYNTIIFSLRRSLIIPYYRILKISSIILSDITKIFLLGRKIIIKCLLQLHLLFEKNSVSENYFILNKLYINDYIIWLQYYFDTTWNEININNEINKLLYTPRKILKLFATILNEIKTHFIFSVMHFTH
jgi:hypothetical protein